MKIVSPAAHHFAIFIRLVTFSLSLALAGGILSAATGNVAELRAQLERAEEANDDPAIVELSRRIIAISPNDYQAWETLISTQLELGDVDRCEQSLAEWARSTPRPPAAIDDFRGDLLVRRKDYEAAEWHWLAFLDRKPDRASAAEMYDKLAELCRTQQRWPDVAKYRAQAIAANDSAGRRVSHAIALLHLRQWDAAFTQISKAREKDSTDAQVKEWLPRFERLQKFLPQIKGIGAQLAKTPNNVNLLLDQARLLTLAELPSVALLDCQQAMSSQPSSVRARIQTGEALLDEKREDDAAKIQVSRNLARGPDQHVSEQALRELASADAAINKDPRDAAALANRSRTLRRLNQFVLALADAQAAIAMTDKSVSGQIEAAYSLKELNQTREALEHAVRATELTAADAEAWFCRGLMEATRGDLSGAVKSQTRSIELRESVAAIRERERCARRLGQAAIADADLKRIQQLEPAKP